MNNHFFAEDEYTYKYRESPNSIVNVFIPYDCKHKCPFCTTKEWYKDININAWWKSFQRVLRNKPSVIMLTGGEPIADLDFLDKILTAIAKHSYDTRVYLNTSFMGEREHLKKAIYIFNKYVNGPTINSRSSDILKGINISRHTPSEIAFRNDFKAKLPIRINILIQGDNFNPEEHIKYWSGKYVEISFREDYKKITKENLFDFSSPVLKYLTDNYILISTNYCHFCNNLTFWDAKDDMNIRYHRGLPYTSTKIGNLTEHMEVILAPNGKLYSDWDCSEEGLDNLLPY